MRVLFVGDIFGRPGRDILSGSLPLIFKTENPDFVVANAENAAGGKGLTPKTAYELFDAGVDVITLGDHVWDRREIFEIIDDRRILRPLNLPGGSPGRGRGVYTKGNHKLCVAILMGRTFIERPMDCPFAAVAKEKFEEPTLIDFHAEATSEKIAMKWFLAGRVSAVLGTHTHIPTDDAVIEKGTAYITDCGMTGPYDSVIGVDKNTIIKRFLTGLPARFEPASGDAQFHGVVVDIEGKKAVDIRKITYREADL
ncbi:MAG: TIGR00282 family metallophosphoesterase [Elusimicrobiota bacterium]|nr:TIGR00282 family metallophosphoesterase [Elusimicrobiota bacterium]